MHDPFAVLGIPEDSDDSVIREAYFTLIAKHPPDRDAEAFTRIRQAYDQIKDPQDRLEYRLFGSKDLRTLETLFGLIGRDHVPAGPEPWLALIEAAKKGRAK